MEGAAFPRDAGGDPQNERLGGVLDFKNNKIGDAHQARLANLEALA